MGGMLVQGQTKLLISDLRVVLVFFLLKLFSFFFYHLETTEERSRAKAFCKLKTTLKGLLRNWQNRREKQAERQEGASFPGHAGARQRHQPKPLALTPNIL